MEKEKVNELVKLLIGLKRYEWSKIKVAVEKEFDSASNRLELKDAESLANRLELEMLFSN